MNRIKKVRIEKFRADSFTATEANRYVRYMPALYIAQPTTGGVRVSVEDAPAAEIATKGVYVASAFAKQDITHVPDEVTGTVRMHSLSIEVRVNGDFRIEDFFRVPATLPAEYNEEIYEAIEEIRTGNDILKKQQLIFRIVDIIVSCSEPVDAHRNKDIAPALEWIDQHPAEHIEVKKMCEMCHRSQVAFFRKLKQLIGITSAIYCNRRRIANAMDLLESSKLSVTDVGIQCGVPDTYYFSKIFKMYTEIPPTAFRSMVRYGK